MQDDSLESLGASSEHSIRHKTNELTAITIEWGSASVTHASADRLLPKCSLRCIDHGRLDPPRAPF